VTITLTRKKTIAAATVLSAAVAAVLVMNGPAGSPPAAVPGRAASSACNAGPADSTIPSGPPDDLAWKSIGPVLVPTSAAYGPTRYRGALWTCFRHDPMGAVLAAYDIAPELITSDWRQAAEDQLVPGQSQRAFIQATENQSFTPPAPGDVAQAVGFQVLTYTPQQAVIETLASDGDKYQAELTTVGWTGGDWKLAVTPDGDVGPDPQLVSSASGFLLWAAGNG
jgi:hypothetical protein